MLESFIGDLTCGTYSNGSDERDLANQWFERCGFGMFPEKTFLNYLIDWAFNVEGTVELWNDIKDIKEELEYSASHKEEFTQEDIDGLKEDMDYWQEQLNDTFAEYKAWMKNEKVGTLEEEIQKVMEWHNGMTQMKDETEIDTLLSEMTVKIISYMEEHKKAVEWNDGEKTKWWIDDENNICIEYESGKCWHYRQTEYGLKWW